jgi:hypothetical protein
MGMPRMMDSDTPLDTRSEFKATKKDALIAAPIQMMKKRKIHNYTYMKILNMEQMRNQRLLMKFYKRKSKSCASEHAIFVKLIFTYGKHFSGSNAWS